MTKRSALESLLQLYDENFVIETYELILQRSPDPSGLQNYVSQLRQGVHKAQIIAELAESPEGQLKAVDLPGLRSLITKHRKRPTSLWHRLLRQLTTGVTEPTERQLRAIDNQLYVLERAIAAQAEQISELTNLLKAGSIVKTGGAISGSLKLENVPTLATSLSHLSPSLGSTFIELKAAIELKQAD